MSAKTEKEIETSDERHSRQMRVEEDAGKIFLWAEQSYKS